MVTTVFNRKGFGIVVDDVDTSFLKRFGEY